MSYPRATSPFAWLRRQCDENPVFRLETTARGGRFPRAAEAAGHVLIQLTFFAPLWLHLLFELNQLLAHSRVADVIPSLPTDPGAQLSLMFLAIGLCAMGLVLLLPLTIYTNTLHLLRAGIATDLMVTRFTPGEFLRGMVTGNLLIAGICGTGFAGLLLHGWASSFVLASMPAPAHLAWAIYALVPPIATFSALWMVSHLVLLVGLAAGLRMREAGPLVFLAAAIAIAPLLVTMAWEAYRLMPGLAGAPPPGSPPFYLLFVGLNLGLGALYGAIGYYARDLLRAHLFHYFRRWSESGAA